MQATKYHVNVLCLKAGGCTIRYNMLATSWSSLAVAGVVFLVFFLAVSSQALFASIPPGPLSFSEKALFNSGVVCLFVSYIRSCTTNPGVVPDAWIASSNASSQWCTKCNKPKPPRTHHCKMCKRSAAGKRQNEPESFSLMRYVDASRRWTTTVLGRQTVYPTERCRTS